VAVLAGDSLKPANPKVNPNLVLWGLNGLPGGVGVLVLLAPKGGGVSPKGPPSSKASARKVPGLPSSSFVVCRCPGDGVLVFTLRGLARSPSSEPRWLASSSSSAAKRQPKPVGEVPTPGLVPFVGEGTRFESSTRRQDQSVSPSGLSISSSAANATEASRQSFDRAGKAEA